MRGRGIILAVMLAVLATASPALAKGTVVIYTAIENEQIADYKKAYDKALPNVEVKMLRLSTGDIAARFMAEKDNMQADVVWGVAATNMLVFKNAGLLEPYAPKGVLWGPPPPPKCWFSRTQACSSPMRPRGSSVSSRSSATRPTRRRGSASTSTC